MQAEFCFNIIVIITIIIIFIIIQCIGSQSQQEPVH